VSPARIAATALAGLALAAGGAAFLLAPRPVDSAAPPAPAAVPTAGVIAAPGRVEPRSRERELAVGVIGALKGVYVEEGDTVRRGQLLAEVDNDDLKAHIAAAEAALRRREAERDRLLHGARPEERRAAAAQLAEAEANLAQARRELDRLLPLSRTGVASTQAVDQARSALAVAEAQQAAKAAAAALINAPPRAEDVAIAEANLSSAQADLQERRALLAKTQLLAPIDGIVLHRYLREGEVISIQPPTPILQIGDKSSLRVRAEIDETDIGRLAVGQRAAITADAYPGERFGGTVARIAPRMGKKRVYTDDPTEKLDTKVLEALIDLDPTVRLPVGLRVDVRIEAAAM
jgi:HlyD family secretion protein